MGNSRGMLKNNPFKTVQNGVKWLSVCFAYMMMSTGGKELMIDGSES
jgi:hypothetical protein